MKSLLFRNLVLMTAMSSMAFLYSCGDDDEETTPDGPSISYSGSLSTQDEFEIGDSVAVQITFDTPGEFSGFNYQITVNKGLDDESSQSVQYISPTDIGFEGGETSGAFNFTIFSEISSDLADKSVTVDMIIVDQLDQQDTATFEFDVITSITTQTETLLGGPQNPDLGSFYDTVDDSVYTVTTAFNSANQANIDFVFWFGTSSQYAIGATDDETAQTAFSSQADVDLDNLSTQNATRFKWLDNDLGDEFDAIETESDLLAMAGETGITDTNVTILSAESVFAFQLDDSRGGKIGLVKVISVDGSAAATRSITIQVKIQK